MVEWSWKGRPASLGARALVLVAAAGLFQRADAQALDVENLRPTSPGDAELIGVESARVGTEGSLSMGFMLSHADDSLVLVDRTGSDDRVASIIGHRTVANLRLAYGLGNGLELGGGIPVILDQNGDDTPVASAAGTQSGIGDAHLFARWRVMGEASRGASLLLSLAVALPTALSAELAGDGGPSAHPTVVGEWRTDQLVAAANLGARLRDPETIGTLEVGSALTYRLGAALTGTVVPMAELAGELAGTSAAEAPIELRGGLRWWASGELALTGGYGRGLVHGYGAPDHRFFVALDLRPGAAPEPLPEPAPIAVIPPNPDPDGDGILGEDDACPDDAEDFDGFEDGDGCPESDNDGDGIADADDACRNHAEDLDGFRDEDGCPDPDNDNDGIVDADDTCPTESEIINGVDDDDGCPDEGEQLVVVGAQKIKIREKLYFANDRDVILPRSEPMLAQLATTLERMPWLKRVRIEGHTDDRGKDEYNRDLSQRRAESVRRALIERGVAEDRLEAVGYGEAQPIDANETVEGRANNRRVEFVIVEQDTPPEGWKPEDIEEMN